MCAASFDDFRTCSLALWERLDLLIASEVFLFGVLLAEEEGVDVLDFSGVEAAERDADLVLRTLVAAVVAAFPRLS